MEGTRVESRLGRVGITRPAADRQGPPQEDPIGAPRNVRARVVGTAFGFPRAALFRPRGGKASREFGDVANSSSGRRRNLTSYHALVKHMKSFLYILLACAIQSAPAADGDLNGRWIIQPVSESNRRALWLEIKGAGTDSITGSMVGGGPGGQLDEIHDARIQRGQLYFHLERLLGQQKKTLVKTPVVAALKGKRLHGAVLGRRGPLLWTGRLAPVLSAKDDGSWNAGHTVSLFDGISIKGWHTLTPGREEGWFTQSGVLKNRERADMLVSDAKFWNFHLHIEYLVHPGMNGGIGLRGRYEVQLLDDHGAPPSNRGNGAIYGRVTPSTNASRPAGEWQTLEVRLVGREVTVVLNGVKTIDRVAIDGFTAMASDWREDRPGPITLQGDHGAIEFRKISLTPLTQ